MITCPSCEEEAPNGSTWCEACGADLAGQGQPACSACGEMEVSDDDYCMACGHKQPSARDHQTFLDRKISAATNRGKKHHHNEDAVAVGALAAGSVVAVLSDGVSSTPGSAAASQSAVIAARNVLITGLNHGRSDPDDVRALLVESAASAQSEAAATTPGPRKSRQQTGGPPSATFVACVVVPTEDEVQLSVAWLGDSRAYWLDGERSRQLTTDHAVDGSLSRWIGADAPDTTPDVVQSTERSGGRLLVCSDGLWRYAADPVELADLVTRIESEGTDGTCEALIDFANSEGGHDNISVALWPTLRPDKQEMSPN